VCTWTKDQTLSMHKNTWMDWRKKKQNLDVTSDMKGLGTLNKTWILFLMKITVFSILFAIPLKFECHSPYLSINPSFKYWIWKDSGISIFKGISLSPKFSFWHNTDIQSSPRTIIIRFQYLFSKFQFFI